MSTRMRTDLETSHHENIHGGERQELLLLAVCTYGLFLLAALYGRLMPSRYCSPRYRETRSIWREAWQTACSTIAFAFNLR